MRQYKSRLLRLMMILIVMVCTVEASGGIGKASSDNLLACIQFSNKGVRGPTIMRGRGYCMPDGQPTYQ
jgi:hypothetical protein